MEKKILFKILSILGIVIMLGAFVVIPDKYPWYYEMLLFNVGMTFWLISKGKKKFGSFINSKMQ